MVQNNINTVGVHFNSWNRLLMGFMFTTAFLSMWISNLASVALMIPIVNAALEQLTRRKSVSYGTCSSNEPGSKLNDKRLAFIIFFHDHYHVPIVFITMDEKKKRQNSLRTSTQVTRQISFQIQAI